MITKRTVWAGLAVMFLLGACGTTATPAPAPSGAQEASSILSVTGKLVPARWATLSARNGGVVEDLPTAQGAVVKAGDLLARVGDSTAYQARLEAARMELLASQQRKKSLQEKSPIDVADALLALADARKACEDAREEAANSLPDYYKGTVLDAKAWLEKAKARHEWLLAHAPDDASGQWLIRLAYEEYLRALQNLQKAEENSRIHPDPTDRSRINYDIRQAKYAQAQARLAEAERHYEEMKAGFDPDVLALADAAITAADAARLAAQSALDACEIRAPFAGTVASVPVRPFEFLAPGQPVLMIGDLATLRVETTDLDEVDVARVRTGLSVDVSFDALPGRVFSGTVQSVAPMSESGSGGVNFLVVIVLDQLDPVLRWGMTAFVDIRVDSKNPA